MKIDNRIFIMPIAPFATLGILRLLWWVAGAEWYPDAGAWVSVIVGLAVGIFANSMAYINDVDLGHTRIWKKEQLND